MSVKTLGNRVAALENSVPIIDDLSDYVLWQAHGRDPSVRWDPVFKQKLEEAFTKMRNHHVAEPVLRNGRP
jgi:hypothetical protein